MKAALITGISGQDGACLASLLVARGYRVVGTSRNIAAADWSNLSSLGLRDRVALKSVNLTDMARVMTLLEEVEPVEVYHLAGQSSVSRSFREPAETIISTTVSTGNLLEAIRVLDPAIRFFNPSSSEMFGECPVPADEATGFNPCSPYGVAKVMAHLQTRTYRELYGLFAVSGILFNHESPFRPPCFVTRKIVSSACRIARGSCEMLELGNLEVCRDWGWAADYMAAAWKMLQFENPGDFVIATGRSHRLETFLSMVFEGLGLDYRDHVETRRSLYRPREIMCSLGNPEEARRLLGWEARHHLEDVVSGMIIAELQRLDAQNELAVG